MLHGIYGPNPHPFPTAFNRELLAVVMVLRKATPPLTIYTDNQAVVDGCHAGKRATTHSAKPEADLWYEFWCLIEDFKSERAGILRLSTWTKAWLPCAR